MRLFFEVEAQKLADFTVPLTLKSLERYYSSVLEEHIRNGYLCTLLEVDRDMTGNFIRKKNRVLRNQFSDSWSVSLGDEVRYEYLHPTLGLSLHLGGWPCDATSYARGEEVSFDVLVRYKYDFYSIPVVCVPRPKEGEEITLKFLTPKLKKF
jgi:hypothetical protein